MSSFSVRRFLASSRPSDRIPAQTQISAVGMDVSRLADGIEGAGRAIIEMIYPRRCAGCQRRGYWVCDDCDQALHRFTPPWCLRCGAPPALIPCRCNDVPSTLAMLRSAALYEGWLGSAIRSFKYAGESARAEHLASLLAPLMSDFPAIDVLMPVPLHPRRERQRGYNQSRLLAIPLGQATSIPMRELLVRERQTSQQVGLNESARRANVRGAFVARPDVDFTGRRVILVDDVMTTGATLGSCAEALHQAGAAWVGAVTLAREA